MIAVGTVVVEDEAYWRFAPERRTLPARARVDPGVVVPMPTLPFLKAETESPITKVGSPAMPI